MRYYILVIKYYIFLVRCIIFMFCLLYHEFWHWIITIIGHFVTLGNIGWPTLNITANKLSITSYKLYMNVEYRYSDKVKGSLWHPLITAAPVIGIIVLFILLPVWMYPFIILCIKGLWLSKDDSYNLKQFFNEKIIG